MNRHAELIQILLWACIEDYAGLWELLWEANSKFSDYPEDRRKFIVRDAVLKLIKSGHVALYQCREPYGKTVRLNTKDAVLAIGDERNWMAPQFDGVSIRASATEEGERIYKDGEFNE